MAKRTPRDEAALPVILEKTVGKAEPGKLLLGGGREGGKRREYQNKQQKKERDSRRCRRTG